MLFSLCDVMCLQMCLLCIQSLLKICRKCLLYPKSLGHRIWMLPVLFLYSYIYTIYIYVFLSSFFRILWTIIIMMLRTTRITKIAFVMTPMTWNHHFNMNLIYLVMEVICWRNNSTDVFVVVAWLEFMVVGFIDVGELMFMAVELMLS